MDERLFQRNAINWFENLLDQIMIPVSGSSFVSDSNVLVESYVIPIELIGNEIENSSIMYEVKNLFPSFICTGNEQIEYCHFGNNEKIEPLIVHNHFQGLKEDYIELVEEFRLLFKLYYDRTKDEYIAPHDNMTVVCKLDNKDSFSLVNKKYLKSYLAVKNMALVIVVDSVFELPDEDHKYESLSWDYKRDDCSVLYSITIGNSHGKNISQFRGKIILKGCQIEDCGVWPYDKKEYLDFIIGMDDNGKNICHSCDPATLSNFFGDNPDEPSYLTPVFFDRSVLEKYLKQTDVYKVESGILRCGVFWSLNFDNENADYVSVYLGDLGKCLPSIEEQHYWRGFNKAIDGHLSETKIDRDFNNIFSPSHSVDFVFKQKFVKINIHFRNTVGWYLFLPLEDRDKYNFIRLHIPLSESQEEFDFLVLSLVKVLIDSLNEKEILSKLKEKQVSGGISRLELWFKELGLVGYSSHIVFLRNLQKLRSSGTGHRKGKDYEKISMSFGLNGANYKEVFQKILCDASSFIDYIDTNLNKLS